MAVIAACLAAIAHIHFAAAMAAAQKPRQKQLPAPYRPSDRGTFAGRIVGNHALVPLELTPGDVALVLILEQNITFRLRAPHTTPDVLAAVLDGHLAHRTSKGIRPGIDRVR